MSSMSAQGVVERASAELSKRINGLGLRRDKHSTKGSVMERVTNVFCGGGNNAAVAAPEKPSRLLPTMRGSSKVQGSTHQNHMAMVSRRPNRVQQVYLTWDQLMMDEKFLGRFFTYFSPCERCVLAQV